MGSSSSRTHGQQKEGQAVIETLIKEKSNRAVVAFTDGSCLGNPGPCGAGAAVFKPDEAEPTELTTPISPRGSILLAELTGIKSVYEHILAHERQGTYSAVNIFCDSQSAVGICDLGWKSNSHHQVIKEVHQLREAVRATGAQTTIEWTPGHASIKGNDLADALAKDAAEQAKHLGDSCIMVTSQDVTKASQDLIVSKWQMRWDHSSRGRHLHTLRNKVSLTQTKTRYPLETSRRKIAQLRTGYSKLNDYLYKIGQATSPECSCGFSNETVLHYLLDCPLYEEDRGRMIHRIHTTTGIGHLSTELLLSEGK